MCFDLFSWTLAVTSVFGCCCFYPQKQAVFCVAQMPLLRRVDCIHVLSNREARTSSYLLPLLSQRPFDMVCLVYMDIIIYKFATISPKQGYCWLQKKTFFSRSVSILMSVIGIYCIFFIFFHFVKLCCPNRNFSMGNSGRFSPKESQLRQTESRYPTLINFKVYVGSFRVSWNFGRSKT